MKKIIFMAALLLCMNVQMVMAQSAINTTTGKHEYSMYTNLIQNIAEEHEQNLSDFLGEQLECRLVKIKTNVFKEPGVFSKGVYSLTLSALCNVTISDFDLKVHYGHDYGNPWGLTVSFKTADGKKHKFYSEQTSRD